MRHELRHVRAFLKVAELASFTRAAADLHISQSGLTVQVKQLEEELGLRLLDRNKRGVSITSAGRDLLVPLGRLVADAEAIVHSAHDISAVRTGTIAIAALPTIAADLLPRAICAFLQTSPNVRITVHDVVADRVWELVAKRMVDFGLGTAQRRDEQVRAKPLYQDRLSAFVPAKHPLAKQTGVTLGELAKCELILPSRESSVRMMVEVAMARQHLTATVKYETNFMPTALAMVQSGLGVAILPESASQQNAAEIIRLAIRKPPMSRQICLLQRADRDLSPAAAKFVQTLRSEMNSESKPR